MRQVWAKAHCAYLFGEIHGIMPLELRPTGLAGGVNKEERP